MIQWPEFGTMPPVDIGGDEAQIIRHCRAEGFLRAKWRTTGIVILPAWARAAPCCQWRPG